MRIHFLSALALVAGCKGLNPDNTAPVNNPPPVATTPPPVTVTVPDPNGDPTTTTAPACTDATLATQAQNVLGQRCTACHGADSPKYGTFGDAADPDALIADGWVIPKDSANSPVYKEISPGANGEPPAMPIADGGGPLVASEIGIVKQWIDCGAESWEGGTGTQGNDNPSARGFISAEMEFTAALGSVAILPLDNDGPDQKDARFLSLVPLYNAGVPADRIKLYGLALNKLMWSMTTEDNPPTLVPVHLDGVTLEDGSVVSISGGLGDSLMFRVDERDFLWETAFDNGVEDVTVDRWEELMKAYPFGIKYDNQFDAAESLVGLTHTRIPIVNGDWFVDNASLFPLYTDVLDIPTNGDGLDESTFLNRFGGIVSQQDDFDNNNIDCAGMDGNASLVSNFNRVQCREDTRDGYCWSSIDYANQAGGANIFGNPVDFFNFRAGGELFCALPDGQQVYFVTNAASNFLFDVPSNVATDYSPDSDRVVHEGQSCMHCHESGVLERDDQLRDSVEQQKGNFDQDTIDQVEEWFPLNSDWPTIYGGDIDQFQRSLTAADVTNFGDVNQEPTWQLSRDYEPPLTQARVAAEYRIPAAILPGLVAFDSNLAIQYSSLFNGTTNVLDRDVMEGVAVQTICDLGLGDDCNFDDVINNVGNDGTISCGEFRNGIFVGSAVPCALGSVCNAEGECSKI